MAKSGESSIVTKCAQVMDIVSHARRPVVFSDIVEQTGFVKSSTHRILAVLQSEGLIEYDKASRTYRTGSRLHDWSRAAWRRIDLQQIASDVMHALSEETGMNTALSVLDGDNILYLRTVDVIQFRYAHHAGDHAPLYSTAAGKIFLAFMSSRKREETLANLTFDRLTENTKPNASSLNDELKIVRELSFAKALGEELLQVTGIAAPIWNAEDKVTASLSLWSETDHVSSEQVVARSSDILKAANEISSQLGWSGTVNNS